jgi:Tfp pilus assembly protein FimV
MAYRCLSVLSSSERDRRGRATRLLVVATVLLASLAIAGCGDSDSETAAQEQLEAARAEGEEAALERERVDDLQRQLRKLKKRVDHGGAAPVAATPAQAAAAAPASAPSEREAFHAPSGNVSCEVSADGALCTVVSVGLTFTLANGEAARVESVSTLGRGVGRLAPFGTSVRIGGIACRIPREDEPRGIACLDSSSGHGFEASRHSERQRVY